MCLCEKCFEKGTDFDFVWTAEKSAVDAAKSATRTSILRQRRANPFWASSSFIVRTQRVVCKSSSSTHQSNDTEWKWIWHIVINRLNRSRLIGYWFIQPNHTLYWFLQSNNIKNAPNNARTCFHEYFYHLRERNKLGGLNWCNWWKNYPVQTSYYFFEKKCRRFREKCRTFFHCV